MEAKRALVRFGLLRAEHEGKWKFGIIGRVKPVLSIVNTSKQSTLSSYLKCGFHATARVIRRNKSFLRRTVGNWLLGHLHPTPYSLRQRERLVTRVSYVHMSIFQNLELGSESPKRAERLGPFQFVMFQCREVFTTRSECLPFEGLLVCSYNRQRPCCHPLPNDLSQIQILETRGRHGD
jgi:hypothetical protein